MGTSAKRIPGPELGDYRRLPIHDSARLRADRWDAPLLTLPEWQWRPHRSDHGDHRSPVRLSEEIDPATQQVIRYHTHREWQARERTIYMDGRAHPPDYAAHTWPGFSTANWDGPMLSVTPLTSKWASPPGAGRRRCILEYRLKIVKNAIAAQQAARR